MYILCFHVPTTHLEIVKAAVFAAGAGKDKNYSHCCWQVLGEGQFMPLAGSKAYLGEIGKIEKVAEYQVTTGCHEADIKNIIAALKQSHPYEIPWYQVWRLEDF